jgi:lipid II:glycine glycyltransferase (peptidoglycan interpeptide bridge formation enzyme)
VTNPMELSSTEINYLLSILREQKDEISLELIQKITTYYTPQDTLTAYTDPSEQMKQLRIELSDLMRNMRKFDPNSLEGHQMSDKAELLINLISELELKLQQGIK